MIWTSYHTDDHKYTRLALKLRQSLDHHALDYHIESVPKIDGPWYLNAALKPHTILRAMDAYGGPAMWIDADATVRRVPTWLGELEQYDYAIVRYKRYHEGGNLIYFNTTPRGRMILTRWKIIQDTYPHIHDEAILTWLWYMMTPMGLKTFFIPERDVAYAMSNMTASIRQWSASNGKRNKKEIGHRDYTDEFRNAIIDNDFTREFSFAECFNRPL